ncbi:MAG: MFS transporter [Betaproteobacteria bacterium]|nr:MFS transporter [Betaproteobacteria bacterium]
MPGSHRPGLRQGLWPFGFLSAAYFTHIGFFNPYLSLWLQHLGLGVFAIGALTALQSATRLVSPFLWAWLSDHTGQRVRLMRLGAMAAWVASGGLYLSPSLWGLSLVMVLLFIHTSPLMSLSEAAMAQRVSVDGQWDTRRYGRVRLWGSVGFLLTVFVAGAWFERRGMADFPHWTVATLAAVNLAVWWMPHHSDEPAAKNSAGRLGPVMLQVPVRWFFAALFFHILAHTSIYVFLSLYLDGLGYSKTMIGLLWALSVVVEVIWFYFQGRWMHRLAAGSWLMLGSAVTVVRMALTAEAADVVWIMALAQMMHAFTFAAHHSACVQWISESFAGSLRARGQALYSVLGYGLTGVIGALGGGAISQAWGMQAVFQCAAVSALAGLWCAWRFGLSQSSTD